MSQLKTDIEHNNALFISQSKETEAVWALANKDGEWLSIDSSEFENSEVMPFWSDQADAQFHCQEDWAEFSACKISLEEFIEDWLVDLANDSILIGLNWNKELEGSEVEADAVVKDYM